MVLIGSAQQASLDADCDLNCVQMLKLQDTMGTQNEGEVHCNPVSEAVMLKLLADGSETSSPRPYTVCDGAGQRTNNRALQPREQP